MLGLLGLLWAIVRNPDEGANEGPEGPAGPEGPQGAEGPQGPEGPAGASGERLITSFFGDCRDGTIDQFDSTQAPAERIKIVEDPEGSGRYMIEFELQEGDPEVASGNRSEAIPGSTFMEGEIGYFEMFFRGISWATNLGPSEFPFDFFWQAHDQSGGSPPIAGQWGKSGEKYELYFANGTNSEQWWEKLLTVAEAEEEIRLAWEIKFHGTEGTLKIWFNGELVAEETGIDTLGEGPIYTKIGIYRGSKSKGTTKRRIGNYTEARVAPLSP